MYWGIISRFSAVSSRVGDVCAILLTLTSTLVGLRASYGTFWSGSSPGPSPLPALHMWVPQVGSCARMAQ
eukprot:382727-Prymnesium_polylepis.1